MNYFAEINGSFGQNSYLVGNEPIDYEIIRFPGGEIQVRTKREYYSNDSLTILARIRNAEDIMTVLLLKEAFHSAGGKEVHLYAPYWSYARQDRSTALGDPFALKVFCNIIKGAGFSSISTLDQHSNVTEVLMGDNFENIIPCNEIGNFISKLHIKGVLSKNISLIAPDAGAVKRVEYLVKFLNDWTTEYNFELAIGLKTRDPNTGKITGYRMLDELHDCAIVLDDLCDGGRSFLELAKALPKRPEFLALFTTHGIYSKGLELLEKEFDILGCCGSFYSHEEYKEKFPSEKLIVI